MSQVRLQPIVQQNVVTYATVIDVPNTELKLKPGMTANVNVEIARSSDVLRVPNSALRFRPTNEIFAALGQTPPDPSQLRAEAGGGRRGGQARSAAGIIDSASRTEAGSAAQPPAGRAPAETSAPPARRQSAAPAGGARPADSASTAAAAGRTPIAIGESRARGGGGRPAATARGSDRFAARLQNMTPEEREQRLQRMRERGGRSDGAAVSAAQRRTAPAGQRPARRSGRGAAPRHARGHCRRRRRCHDHRCALRSAGPRSKRAGRVWLYVDNQLKPVRLRLGISDGQNTELHRRRPAGRGRGGHERRHWPADNAAGRPTSFPFGQPGRGGVSRRRIPGGGRGGGGGRRGGGGGR